MLTAGLLAVIGSGVGGWRPTGWTVGRRQRASDTERTQLLEHLAEIMVDLGRRLDHSEMLERVARSAAELVGADAAAFVHVEGDRSTIVALHQLPESLRGFAASRGEGVVNDIITSQEPAVISDYHTHPHHIPAVAAAMPDLHTMAVVPGVVDGEVIAALFVLFRAVERDVSQSMLDVLRLLAGHAGTTLANAAMYAEVVRREAHELAVIEALADGVAVMDRSGVITSWNSAAATMTGICASDAIGRPPRVPVPRPGSSAEHELPNDRWLEILSSQLPETGEMVLVLRDVSEQKALERAQSLFLATTTHEIKTPLTVVSGFATTLQRRWDDLTAEDRERALGAIVRRSDALVKLIDQLLLGFRVRAGQLDLDLRGFDLRPTLDLAVSGFSTLSEAHKLTLDVEPDLPLVIGDVRAVDQVLAQLLENAIKYSPSGGEITVGAKARDGVVAVFVRDRGVGLRSGEGDRVFSRYFRGTNKETRKTGGVGLGLYIVRQLVEAQGGTVGAEGNPEGGSTFEFTLPAAG